MAQSFAEALMAARDDARSVCASVGALCDTARVRRVPGGGGQGLELQMGEPERR